MSTESETTRTPETQLPPVLRAAWVNRPVDQAFDVFTKEIGAWWPLPTHGLFGTQSGGVAFRDGRLVEQSIDGTEVVWGEVLVWESPARFVMSWHPGQDPSTASQVEVSFEQDGAGTQVTVEHRGWEIFGSDATMRRLGYVGPNAWGYVLDHYGDAAELRPDAIDLTELALAYSAFFDEAELGCFGPAPEGEWNAEQVVAHVALNDAAILGVCQALIHETVPRFENQVCQNAEVLAQFVESAADMPSLIAHGRSAARLVLAALVRLAPEQRSTEVHCTLTHDGELMMDQPVPWESVAVSTQAAMHLPAHIDQLRNLRA